MPNQRRTVVKKLFFALCTVLILLSGCGTTVNRIQSGTQSDLSGYWNALDVRIVCDALISDILSNPRVDQEIRAMGNRKPIVIVGRFRNDSDEHIDTEIITSIMEASVFNSGRLDFVAGGDTRDDLRSERQDQQSYASEETAARLGRELGADFMLTGSVRTIVDRNDTQIIRTYFVTAELTNIETNARMWIGQNNEITKVITRPRNRL